MKKLLILFLAICLISCSSDDDSNEQTPENDLYTFGYTDECYQPSTGSFCVTKEALDEAMENPFYVDDVCFKIRIENPQGELELYIFSYSLNSCD